MWFKSKVVLQAPAALVQHLLTIPLKVSTTPVNKLLTKTLHTGNEYFFFNTEENSVATEQHSMDQIHLCSGSHTFSQLCLACFSHCYIIKTTSSPNGYMNIKGQDLQEKTKQHRKV